MTALRSALAFALLAFCSAEASRTQDSLRALPCPEPEDILPCVCTVTRGMDMDCSAVADEDELARVFSTHFPVTNFRALIMIGNHGMKTLRRGDLGAASFQAIFIYGGSLEEVQTEALTQSYATLESLSLASNKLSSFPFHELPLFTSCAALILEENSLTKFPSMESASLTELNMHGNYIKEIPADAFRGLSNLEYVRLSSNQISEILPETFLDLGSIQHLFLGGNNISHIPEGAFEFSGNNLEGLELEENNITLIEVGGIKGLANGFLSLNSNNVTILSEDVFRPILEAGNYVALYDNPLECGCDLAWLVTNPTFMGLVDRAICYNGTPVADLDPAIYEDLC